MTVPSDRTKVDVLRRYAEASALWTHGEKTEDELLQRIWNLSGDVANLLAALLVAERERDTLRKQLDAAMQYVPSKDLRWIDSLAVSPEGEAPGA